MYSTIPGAGAVSALAGSHSFAASRQPSASGIHRCSTTRIRFGRCVTCRMRGTSSNKARERWRVQVFVLSFAKTPSASIVDGPRLRESQGDTRGVWTKTGTKAVEAEVHRAHRERG